MRFELTVRCRITSFQDWLLKPLGQLSMRKNYIILHRKCQDMPCAGSAKIRPAVHISRANAHIAGLLDNVLTFLCQHPVDQLLDVGIAVALVCHCIHRRDDRIGTVLDVFHVRCDAVNGDELDIGVLDDALHVEAKRGTRPRGGWQRCRIHSKTSF